MLPEAKLPRSFREHIPYVFTYLVVALAMFFTLAKVDPWGKQRFNHRVIQWDISLYYLYLPATFIYSDLGIEETWPIDLGEYQITDARSETGRYQYKMTAGMAMVYAPGFALGHMWALVSDQYEANGFSLPYEKALISWMLLFTLIGGWFLFLFLSRFFYRSIALIVVIIMLLGTNLLYYTLWDGAMAHCAGFALISLILELSMQFLKRRSLLIAAAIGLFVGLAVLIRPTNAVPLTVPLVVVLLSYRNEWRQLLKPAALGLLFLLIPWAIQIAIWNYTTGSLINYGYGEERFFWTDPQIIRGFFSWRKGWFVYTPIMAFAILGFVSLRRLDKLWFRLTFSIFILHVYVTFSWWCWWYGGGYGQRAMIELYPLLALPLSAFLSAVAQKKWFIQWATGTVLLLLVSYNVFTAWQAAKSLMHYDAMTEKAYKAVFLKTVFPRNYVSYLDPPDYEAAKRGERDQ